MEVNNTWKRFEVFFKEAWQLQGSGKTCCALQFIANWEQKNRQQKAGGGSELFSWKIFVDMVVLTLKKNETGSTGKKDTAVQRYWKSRNIVPLVLSNNEDPN